MPQHYLHLKAGACETVADYLKLADVAKIAPGRPSSNCVWRWCRRGLRSRGGGRVRLRHVRLGGIIYTTAEWLDDFGQALAEADARHFDRFDSVPPPPAGAAASASHGTSELDRIERELDEAGI